MVRRLVHLRHDEWDRPRCSMCSAGRAGEIDLLRIEKLLADRAKLKAVAAKFGLKHDALRRHWEGVSTDRKNYLRVGRQLSQEALAAATAEEKVSTIDHLRIGGPDCTSSFSTRSRLTTTEAAPRWRRRWTEILCTAHSWRENGSPAPVCRTTWRFLIFPVSPPPWQGLRAPWRLTQRRAAPLWNF